MSRTDHKPPKWAIRWMEWWARPSEVDEIIGDATEMYYKRCAHAPRYAGWCFVWDMIRYTRWSTMRRRHWTFGSSKLFNQYIVLGWRAIRKRKLSSAINIFGLAIAVACMLVAFAFNVRWILNDRYHEHREAIYLVTFHAPENDELQEYGITPVPLGDRIREAIPQVNEVVRVYEQRGTMHANDRIFNEHLRFIEPSFFDMFSYSLKYGQDPLRDQTITVSDRVAEKYFGNIDPVGEPVTIYIDSVAHDFTIGSVVDAQDESNSLKFSVLIPFSHWEPMMQSRATDWNTLVSATFLQIDDPDQVHQVGEQIQDFLPPFNEARQADDRSASTSFNLQPLTQIKKTATDINYNYTGARSTAPMVLLTIIGVLMLVLSLINYVNISLDMVSRRLKETGIRKVMGSSRRQILVQFMTENALLCLFAISMGVVLAIAVLIPGFNDLASVNLRLDFLNDPVIWMFLSILFLGIVLISGAYPAYHIASYRPVSLFRQQLATSRNRLTLPFLFLQFALAALTIVAGTMFVINDTYQQNRSWGYDPTSQLVVPLQPAQFSAMRSILQASPEVASIAGAEHHAGAYAHEMEATIEETSYEVKVLAAETNYAELMGFELVSGSYLDPAASVADVLVNETLLRDWLIEDYSSVPLMLEEQPVRIVGVVKDFYFEDYEDKIEPLIIKTGNERAFRYLVAKGHTDRLRVIDDLARSAWTERFPHIPYRSYHQSESFDDFLLEMQSVTKVISFTAFLAIMLSCMGLYGVVALRLAAKQKSLSIRKVLGASGLYLLRTMLQRQLLWIGTAAALGCVGAFYGLEAFFGMLFDEHAPITIQVLLGSVLALMAIAGLTIASRGYTILSTNPAEVLSQE